MIAYRISRAKASGIHKHNVVYGSQANVDLTSCVLVYDIDGLVQDCSNSSALAVELLQSYTKPSI